MFGNYMNFIEKTMDVSALQRKTNADNIANYNTPDFKASTVTFDKLVNQEGKLALKTSSNNHYNSDFLPYQNIKTEQDFTTKTRQDGNNVDLTAEMIDTIKLNETYSRAVKALNSEISLTKIALTVS